MKEEHLLTGILESTNEPYAIAKIAGIKMCQSYNRQFGTHYFSVMPTNLYGPHDNYHLENSHVIPAIIRKYHLAKLAKQGNMEEIRRDERIYGTIPQGIKSEIGLASDSQSFLPHSKDARVLLWGSGKARREFLHVDDMASACIHIMNIDQAIFENLGDEPTYPCSFINVGCGIDNTIREVAGMIQGVVGFEGSTVFDTTQPDGTMQKLLDTEKIDSLSWAPQYDLQAGIDNAYQWYCNNLTMKNFK